MRRIYLIAALAVISLFVIGVAVPREGTATPMNILRDIVLNSGDVLTVHCEGTNLTQSKIDGVTRRLVCKGTTPTVTRTSTSTQVPPTLTSTSTATLVPSNTPTSTWTNTPIDTATATNTLVPTETPTATNTPTSTATPVDTNTPTNTVTSTVIPTITNTPSPIPSGVWQRVDVPDYGSDAVWVRTTAIAWYGKPSLTDVYTDLRFGYNNQELYVQFLNIDRYVYNADAVTLILDHGGHRYQIDVTFTNNVTLHIDGQIVPHHITSAPVWRGDGINGVGTEGWWDELHIPWQDLGGSKPSQNESWAVQAITHNNDGGTTVDTNWKSNLVFGPLYTERTELYTPPAYSEPETVGIRNAQAGQTVLDAVVGGGTLCGGPADPDSWNKWGDLNWQQWVNQGNPTIDYLTLQNQQDVADWRCFSRFYGQFPLDLVPPGKVIISATLTLYNYGHSGYGCPSQCPLPVLGQVFEVNQTLDPNTVTWNNGALPLKAVDAQWIPLIDNVTVFPHNPVTWDVSGAVARAYTQGRPFDYLMYDSDTPISSGEYMDSSRFGTFDAGHAPILTITYGDSVIGPTPVDTITPSNTLTTTPTSQSTNTPTLTPTLQPTVTPTLSLTGTSTTQPTIPPTPSSTNTPTPSPTVTSTPSKTPILGPTPTPGAVGSDWPMSAGNPQRTSHNSVEVPGNLKVDWYRSIEPYVDNKTQVIGIDGKVFVATSKGLYAFDATTGEQLWVYGTELPVSSPTVVQGVVYLPGFDHRIQALDINTGLPIQGYTPYEAGAGFETNPVVVNGIIYNGNRDGNFYALNSTTGNKLWSYDVGSPIKFSPAYKDGVLYFGSDNGYAYALNINGSLKWKSNQLPGVGFGNYWPVVWTDPLTNQNYVIYTTSKKATRGLMRDSVGYSSVENSDIPWGNGCVPATTSYVWSSITQVLDCSVLTDYYNNQRPDRRNLFIFSTNQNSTTAVEYQPYAPVNYQGAPNGGYKYPPIVGKDGVLYTDIGHSGGGNGGSSGWISGWKFGTSYISNIWSDSAAGDEPPAFTSGGNLIYWGEAINHEAWGTLDVSKPVGSNFYSWPNLRAVPGADDRYSDNDGNPSLNLASWFNGSNTNVLNGTIAIYDGLLSMSPVPYNQHLYLLNGNVLFALSPNGSGKHLPTVTVSTNQAPANITLSRSDILARLNTEIQKILEAGHLRPGFSDVGYMSPALDSGFGRAGLPQNAVIAGDHLLEYFHTPGDTLVTLSAALPYLSPTLQSQVKDYLQKEELSYPVESLAHIGYLTGALREAYPDTPEMTAWFKQFYPSGGWVVMSGPSQTTITQVSPCCATPVIIGSFPADAPYAAWKYAQAQNFTLEQALALFNSMKPKLQQAGVGNDMTDSNLLLYPYILNQYINGYRGYLELEKMAGVSQDTVVAVEYTRLLNLRVSNFSKDAPHWALDVDYPFNRILNVARNFMYLTPELGSEMPVSATQQALAEYSTVEPYWFVGKYEQGPMEGEWAPLWSRSALFQARARILQQPFSELVKYLDVPAFERGDLFYIQNLVALLNAP